jgi:hypothetical protein
VATNRARLVPAGGIRSGTLLQGLYALGAVSLAGEAVVHVQQYFSLYHEVSWIGPLFLLDAVASVVVIAGLGSARTRELAALAGVLIAVLSLGGLIVSYGTGLFGWQEAGFSTAIELVLIFEVLTVVLLSAALAAESAQGGR